jgi:hypothetical protein
MPQEERSGDLYSVKVDGKSLPMHIAYVSAVPYNRRWPGHQRPKDQREEVNFGLFSMDGPVEIEIMPARSFETVVVRPLSLGITPAVENGIIRFTLKKPAYFTVELDGYHHALHMFADAVDEYATVDKTAPDVLYFGPGVHETDVLLLKSGQTVFVDEGAVVYCKGIAAYNADNVRILGRGILDNSRNVEKIIAEAPQDGTIAEAKAVLNDERTHFIQFGNCRNILIDGVTLRDSLLYNISPDLCTGLEIRHTKLIGNWRYNSDGIDMHNCKNVHISDCFIRTYDDSFVVKSLWGGDVEDVIFEQSTLWNDMARPMEVGVEMRCAHVRNITFRDIDVIHSLTPYPIFGIHHGDRALVSDIRFENIRIEHAPGGQLFDFRITDSVWNKDLQKGEIRNLYIDNITLLGEEGKDFRHVHCRAAGFDAQHTIENIHIGRITAFGKVLSGCKALGLQTNAFTRNVVFDAPDTPVLTTQILPGEPFVMGADGRYHGTLKLALRNDTAGMAGGEISLMLFPRGMHSCDETPKTYRLAPGEQVVYEYDVTAAPGKLAAETRSSRVDCRNHFWYCELDYPLLKSTAKAPALPLTTLYGHHDGEVRFALRNGWLEIAADAMKHHDLTLYVAMPAAERADNEVLFTVEESYYGEGPCIKWKDGALCPAPEIGNHFEITYVFLNQPKTSIHTLRLPRNHEGMIRVPLVSLGLPKDCKHLWLELELHKPIGCCKPYTLFRSTLPQDTAHMFCSFRAVD